MWKTLKNIDKKLEKLEKEYGKVFSRRY